MLGSNLKFDITEFKLFLLFFIPKGIVNLILNQITWFLKLHFAGPTKNKTINITPSSIRK